MSSADGFRRCDGFVGSVPQNFINANFHICPLCGSRNPYWLLKDKMEFSAHRVMFRCSDCGCILSATQGDFTGRTKSTAYNVLTTAGAVDALVKKSQGKDVKTIYIKVEDVGDKQTTSELLGKELPIEEFQRMSAAFEEAPAAQPAPAPAPAAQPAADNDFKVTYATPAPAADFKVTYAEPAPAAQPAPAAAPAANTAPAAASAPAAEKKLPVLPLILLASGIGILFLASFINYIVMWVSYGRMPSLLNYFQTYTMIAAMGIAALPMLFRKEKFKELCGWGVLLLSAVYYGDCGIHYYFNEFLQYIIAFVALAAFAGVALVGVCYLKNKDFLVKNAKLYGCIAALFGQFVLLICNFSGWGIVYYLAATVLPMLAFIFYTPYDKENK